MTNWKYFALFALVVSLTPCFATNKRCVWVIDAVEKENLSMVAQVFVPEGNYFLRIRVKCDHMINSEMVRSLVLTGVNPLISIESEAFGLNHHKAKRYSMLISTSLIEMGNQESCGCFSRNKNSGNDGSNKCFCNGVKPSCSHSETVEMMKAGIECCQYEKNCSNFLELCNPAWLAPLRVPEMVTTLHCKVVDSGIGPYIDSHRLTVHLDRFHLLVNNTIYNRLGKDVTQLPSVSQQIPVNCVPNLSPVCVIGSLEMSNHVIYTTSEFEKMQFVKIQLEDSVQNRCASKQSQSSVEVICVLSLPDRILLNTGAGIFEVQADHTNMPTNVESLKDYTLVFSGCVSHVVSPAQPSVHTVTLLGFGEDQDQEKIFLAFPEKGTPLNFTEQKDSSGQNVCQFLRVLFNTDSHSCQAISGSLSGVKTQSFVTLVMLKTSHAETFHLVRYQGTAHAENWTALFHFPASLKLLETDHDHWQRMESTFSAENSEGSTLSLTGLAFTAVVCDSLFIWGNALFYSPDGGISIHWLTDFPGNSTIMVFTSSPFDGTFAFLTDKQEVWVGQAGSAKLQRLESSVGGTGLTPGLSQQNDSFVLSIFFDSSGRLQQIVADGRGDDGKTECISREEIPVGRIISRQVFAQKQEENIRNFQNAKTKSTSCVQKPSANQNLMSSVERACPFARISFEAKHEVLYTRKCFYRLEPSVHWDSGLIQKSATLHEYFTRVNEAINPECSGISHDRRETLKDFLPDVIQLGRSEWYSFVFYLYLDYDFQVETSTHSWSLTHLQASLHASDATVLNMTSRRTERIPQKAVKYEVTVQDGGLRLPQYRPGEGLTPASLHIQIWNSGLSCSTGYGSSGYLQGSYVMTVLLGCPAGRKLVFDPEASKNASGKKHFCSPVHGVPCFYFYRDFLPVFKVLDLATGQVSQFHGKYGLKIVGGGPSYQSVTDYSQEEQTKYNYQTTSSMASLIWASKLKTLGDVPVFNSKTNGISWLCGTQSPCADIGPNFPGNAEYYFKLEFSNRIVDADSSNCDYTIRFLIRVHGLPPGSFNPSSVIVLSCIGILVALILTFFLLKRQEAKLWRRLKSVLAVLPNLCRERIYSTSGLGMRGLLGLRRNKVDPLVEQVQLETIHQAMNKDAEDSGDASVDIRENTPEQHLDSSTNV